MTSQGQAELLVSDSRVVAHSTFSNFITPGGLTGMPCCGGFGTDVSFVFPAATFLGNIITSTDWPTPTGGAFRWNSLYGDFIGTVDPNSVVVTTVPEPSTLVLLAIGLVVIAVVRFRQKATGP